MVIFFFLLVVFYVVYVNLDVEESVFCCLGGVGWFGGDGVGELLDLVD